MQMDNEARERACAWAYRKAGIDPNSLRQLSEEEVEKLKQALREAGVDMPEPPHAKPNWKHRWKNWELGLLWLLATFGSVAIVHALWGAGWWMAFAMFVPAYLMIRINEQHR